MTLSKLVRGVLLGLTVTGCSEEGTVSLQKPERKTYEIGAYSVNGSDLAKLEINGRLYDIPIGKPYNLPTGEEVTVNWAVTQSYAGGINGAGFKLVGACPDQMDIEAFFIHYGDNRRTAEISVNGEGFVMEPGQTQRLMDGTAVTFDGRLRQDFAGGSNGTKFKIDC